MKVPEGGILTVICVSLYCRIRLVILGRVLWNTDSEASVMGENWRGYGCKECLHRVKGRWTTREGQRPRCPCGDESWAARTLPLP